MTDAPAGDGRPPRRSGAAQSSAAVFLRSIHETVDAPGVASVFCSRNGAAVDIQRCRSCAACRGLVVDTTERSTFLRCAFGAPNVAGTLAASATATRETEAFAREPVSSLVTSPVPVSYTHLTLPTILLV